VFDVRAGYTLALCLQKTGAIEHAIESFQSPPLVVLIAGGFNIAAIFRGMPR
jgi:hypothetical protein